MHININLMIILVLTGIGTHCILVTKMASEMSVDIVCHEVASFSRLDSIQTRLPGAQYNYLGLPVIMTGHSNKMADQGRGLLAGHNQFNITVLSTHLTLVLITPRACAGVK